MTTGRPIWDTLTDSQKASVERETAKVRPLDQCDPARVTRLAVALGLRPAHLPATHSTGGDARD